MGIPHLYTHLRPYARPESFSPGSRATLLYIDGPGLAHHVYHLALCSTNLSVSNPWESAVPYSQFEAAIIKYLDLLTSASFLICKIYFDGHLPMAKRPTRLSRLDNSLRKLKSFHSLHPHTLRCSAPKQHSQVLDVLSPTATYNPRTSPLSAPPFILAAMIEVLSKHPTYSATVCTIPGEAESYCARDAISTNGIVLTGDSDLFLFASPSESDWGVMMFKDVDIVFPGPKVSAVVFRPTEMIKSLGVDLTFLGFLTMCDTHASFSTLRQRAIRIAERKKSGTVVEEYGKRWREFAAVYALPPQCDPNIVLKGVEPRIAEIIQQQKEKCPGDERIMFMPFLWEDPSRGSAWDAGRSIRAVAYSLLFPGTDGIDEVCRRGQRVSAGLIKQMEDPYVFLHLIFHDNDEKWWVHVILEEIMTVFESRGQRPPEGSMLEGIAYMLCQTASLRSTSSASKPRKWTWERIQMFALAQAAWYSLLLVKEVLFATTTSIADDEWVRRLATLPGVADCIDGNCFLDGTTLASSSGTGIVKAVVAAHHARVAKKRKGEEAAALDVEMKVDSESGTGNGNNNNKRSSDLGTWVAARTGKKKRKEKGSAGVGRELERKKLGEKKEQGSVGDGNFFATLAGGLE